MDNKDLILSKKLISNYKVRLEAEIIKRSKKLRISQQMSEDIITSNCEIKEIVIFIKYQENTMFCCAKYYFVGGSNTFTKVLEANKF